MSKCGMRAKQWRCQGVKVRCEMKVPGAMRALAPGYATGVRGMLKYDMLWSHDDKSLSRENGSLSTRRSCEKSIV